MGITCNYGYGIRTCFYQYACICALLFISTHVAAVSISLNSCTDDNKSCILSPPDCDPVTSCTAILTYEAVGNDRIRFQLGRKLQTNAAVYVAVGFSKDRVMGDDAVSLCSFSGSTAKVSAAYNSGHTSSILSPQPDSLYTNIQSSVNDTFAICQFDQLIDPDGLAKEISTKVFPLNQKYYLLLVIGAMKGDQVSYHGFTKGSSDYPTISESQILLSTTTITTATPTAAALVTDATTLMPVADCDLGDMRCLRKPADCSPPSNCSYVLTYKPVGRDRVRFQIGIPLSETTSYYVAVGFSKDNKMGDDAVTACVSKSGTPEIITAYNPGKYNEILQTPPKLYTNVNTSLQNGFLFCEFEQSVTVPENGGTESGKIFPLNQPLYILLAKGLIKDGKLSAHEMDDNNQNYPVISDSPILLIDNSTSAMTEMITQAPVAMAQASSAEFTSLLADCGKIKGCFFAPNDCKGASCSSFFSFTNTSDNMGEFELGSRLSTVDTAGGKKKYTAVGFSKDEKMGDDSVIACVLGSESGPEVTTSYNKGKSNAALPGSAGIEVVARLQKDDYYLCRFRRLFTLPTGSDPKIFGLRGNQYYILMATGEAKPDNSLQRHDLTPGPEFPVVSSRPMSVDLFAPGESVTAKQQSNYLTGNSYSRALTSHGIIMLIAWWIFVPTAILFVKYFKSGWPDQMPGGAAVWFQLHRGLNTIGVLLFLSAFILVFIAKGRWVGKPGDANRSHAICGLVAVICGVSQVISSFLRCKPKTKSRFIFNYYHAFMGNIAFGVANGAVMHTREMGFFMDHKKAAFALMITYIVFWCIIILIMEIHVAVTERPCCKGVKPTPDVPMQAIQYDQNGDPITTASSQILSPQSGETPYKSSWIHQRLIILAIFLLFAIGVVVTLVVFMVVKHQEWLQ